MATDPRSVARAVAEVAAAHAEEGEARRRLAPPVVDALREGGLLRLCLPREVGGLAASPTTLVRCVEEVASGDGSAGWCLLIAATAGAVAHQLDPEVAGRIFRSPGAVATAVYGPRGEATRTDGGIRLSGRWPWATGCQHSTVFLLGVPVAGRHHLAVVPPSDLEVLDTWRAAGLRGTGSHDVAVADRFVPDTRLVPLGGPPRIDAPLARLPFFSLLAVGVGAVALGIGRAAVDALVELAGTKVPAASSSRPLARRTAVQADVARADALLQAGRVLLETSVEDAWATARRRGTLSTDQRAQLRLAATMATRWAAEAVDLAQAAAGGTAVLEDAGPLARCFRDVHAVTQHVLVGPTSLEAVGRVRLGVDPEGAGL